jgi:hypothetical protein
VKLIDYPYFICIGAKKSGTSWLHWVLGQHPEIWMPPLKEIHYFDDELTTPIFNRMFRLNSKKDVIAKHIFKYSLINIMKPKNLTQINWFYRLLFNKRSDEYYSSLFNHKRGIITGDVTPDYAALPTEKISLIAKSFPNLKIIYILRNPINRIWSDVAMKLSFRGRPGIDKASEKLIMKFFNTADTTKNSEYLKNLSSWENHFPLNNVFIGFYDQIDKDPFKFIRSLLKFLDIGNVPSKFNDNINKKVNYRIYPEIPKMYKSFLYKKYHNEIVLLHKEFNNEYTQSWLDDSSQYF